MQPKVIGKPSSEIFFSAMRLLNAKPESTLMIGDRLNTDILGAQNAGIQSIAVLTGITTLEGLAQSKIQPDAVFSSVEEIATALEDAYSE
jgi:ribonucleotide monophosphatase NagD (HAD superfamily)